MTRTGTPVVARRTTRRLLVVVTALAVTLGAQLLQLPAASAATGPTVVDGGGTVSVSTYEVLLPGARDDLAGSSAIKYGLTVFTATQPSPLPAGSSVSPTLIYDAGFGTWKIGGDGRMTFDTTAHVTGTRSVRYRITDAAGLTAEGLQTVTVTAGAGNDDLITTQGTSITTDLLANDTPGRNADGSPGTIDRASLRWRATQGAPVNVSSDGLVITFPRIGVFAIDATSRLLTFTPDPAYVRINDSYALYYTVQDTTRTADGSVQHHPVTGQVRWDVRALDALVVTEKASPELFFHVGDLLTFTTTISNVGPTPLSALALTHSLGSRLTETCSPALGTTLAARSSTTCTATTRARQGDFDTEGGGVGDIVRVTATTPRNGQTIPLSTQTGAQTGSRITQGLTVTGTATPSSVSAAGQRVGYTFVVRNRGNRSVKDLLVSSSSPGVSALVCAPVALGGTLGDNRSTTCSASRTTTAADLTTSSVTATVKATAVPVAGFHATAANASATVRTTVTDPSGTVPPAPPAAGTPVARPDTASADAGLPVVVDVLANDTAAGPTVPLVGSSVRLRLPASALPAGSALYGDAKTLKVAGRGTFLVSGTGEVTFVPLGTATGPVPTIGYQVADVAGTTARSTLTVTVR